MAHQLHHNPGRDAGTLEHRIERVSECMEIYPPADFVKLRDICRDEVLLKRSGQRDATTEHLSCGRPHLITKVAQSRRKSRNEGLLSGLLVFGGRSPHRNKRTRPVEMHIHPEEGFDFAATQPGKESKKVDQSSSPARLHKAISFRVSQCAAHTSL